MVLTLRRCRTLILVWSCRRRKGLILRPSGLRFWNLAIWFMVMVSGRLVGYLGNIWVVRRCTLRLTILLKWMWVGLFGVLRRRRRVVSWRGMVALFVWRSMRIVVLRRWCVPTPWFTRKYQSFGALWRTWTFVKIRRTFFILGFLLFRRRLPIIWCRTLTPSLLRRVYRLALLTMIPLVRGLELKRLRSSRGKMFFSVLVLMVCRRLLRIVGRIFSPLEKLGCLTFGRLSRVGRFVAFW